jgi:hypothetical protein
VTNDEKEAMMLTRLAVLRVCVALCFFACSISPLWGSEPGQVVAYNVKQAPYNAAGNGTTDDTTAVTNAISAAAAAGGGIVFFPQGTYLVSPLTLSRQANVALAGAGPGTIIKLKNGSNATGVITLSNASFVVIRDLMVDGNGANQTNLVAGVALQNGSTNNVINKVVVKNATAEGIGIYQSTGNNYSVISENKLMDNGFGTTCGQLVNMVTDNNQLNDTESFGIYPHETTATENTVTGNLCQNIPATAPPTMTTGDQKKGIVEAYSANFNLISANDARLKQTSPGIAIVGANTIAANNLQ